MNQPARDQSITASQNWHEPAVCKNTKIMSMRRLWARQWVNDKRNGWRNRAHYEWLTWTVGFSEKKGLQADNLRSLLGIKLSRGPRSFKPSDTLCNKQMATLGFRFWPFKVVTKIILSRVILNDTWTTLCEIGQTGVRRKTKFTINENFSNKICKRSLYLTYVMFNVCICVLTCVCLMNTNFLNPLESIHQ